MGDEIILWVYGVGCVVGVTVIGIRRLVRWNVGGRLSQPDGERRVARAVHQRRLELVRAWRKLLLRFAVPEQPRLAFRIEGKLHRADAGLSGRVFITETLDVARVRAVLAHDTVRQALAALLGAEAPFSRLDLYPGGLFLIETDARIADDVLDDLVARAAEFVDAVVAVADVVVPDDGVDLGAQSGTASSAAFSIEIRQ